MGNLHDKLVGEKKKKNEYKERRLTSVNDEEQGQSELRQQENLHVCVNTRREEEQSNDEPQ